VNGGAAKHVFRGAAKEKGIFSSQKRFDSNENQGDNR
jgi:hypothetical protein